jgi:uncharacterized protein (TIGR03086 family)
MSDALATHRRAIDEFSRRVEAADGHWDDPAPCEGWKARDVAEHVTGNHRMIAERFGDGAPDPSGDPAADWTAARDAALRTLEQADLSAVVDGPMGPMPGEVVLGIMTNDTLIHTWDLARAVGADEQLPDDMAQAAYESMSPFDEMLRSSGMFGARIDVPESASSTERLVAFSGRQP